MSRFFRLSSFKHRYNSFFLIRPEIFHQIKNNVFTLNMNFSEYLQKCCSLFILNIGLNNNMIELSLSRRWLLHLVCFLNKHTNFQFNFLIDYTVIDLPGKILRFECIILLLSTVFVNRIKLRFFTNEIFPLSTISKFYKFAFWLEREIWDMFGLLFNSHGDLRRLLTDYGFWGHPLRKDFPVVGFFEIFFDDFSRNITKAKVSLAQEYRYYIFHNSWLKV